MATFISPRYLDVDFPPPLSVDNAITVYEDQVRGWFLDVARQLTENIAADFVTLMVITSYFEGYEIMRRGEDSRGKDKITDESKSLTFFRAGFNDVIQPYWQGPEPSLDEVANTMYDQVRCGLFHTGMTRIRIGLDRGSPEKPTHPLEARPANPGEWYIVFNVPGLLEIVNNHFRQYLSRLRNAQEEELREHFKQGWNLRVKGENSRLTIS